jgi:hypothetical protein
VSGFAEALYPRLPIYLQNLACAWSGARASGLADEDEPVDVLLNGFPFERQDSRIR